MPDLSELMCLCIVHDQSCYPIPFFAILGHLRWHLRCCKNRLFSAMDLPWSMTALCWVVLTGSFLNSPWTDRSLCIDMLAGMSQCRLGIWPNNLHPSTVMCLLYNNIHTFGDGETTGPFPYGLFIVKVVDELVNEYISLTTTVT